MAALVRRTLAEVYTVPVLLVNDEISPPPSDIHFPGEPGLASSSWFSSFTCPGRELLGDKWHRFVLRTGCQTPNIQSESTDPNQWHDLILSSPTIGLLMGGALLPLYWWQYHC